MASMAAYVGLPLDSTKDTIRLLRIEKGRRSDPFKCHLFVSHLDKEGIEYKALSYTWGGPGSNRGIDVAVHRPEVHQPEVHQLEVKENLYSALKEIRSQTLDVILWVDAICIDQENMEEKGHQVKRMGKIYAGAVEVLIWLGPSDHGLISLMDSINWISKRAFNAQSMGTREDWLSLCGRLAEERFCCLGEDARSRQSEALRQLLRRPWFKRVWILQEVANAKTALIMGGSKACSAQTFALMPFLMKLDVDEHTQAVLDIMPGHRKVTWWTNRRFLHFLLVKFAESQAKKPVDKIYALLGISEDANNPDRFDPNYEIDESEVLRNTLSFLLFQQVLDGSYTFPTITFQELSQSITDLAIKTLRWALSETEIEHTSARRTAMLIVGLINQGQFKWPDLQSALAGQDAQASDRLQSFFRDQDVDSIADIRLDLTFEGNKATLTVNSDTGIRIAASFTFPEEQSGVAMPSHEPERPFSPKSPNLGPAPFEEDEDMAETILLLKERGASKKEPMRAYIHGLVVSVVFGQLVLLLTGQTVMVQLHFTWQ